MCECAYDDGSIITTLPASPELTGLTNDSKTELIPHKNISQSYYN